MGLAAGAARGAPGMMFGPDSSRFAPKDFTLVRDDGGLTHAFYILTNTTPGYEYHFNERRFGHSVSSDLVHWQFVDSSFVVRADQWDRDHVWSPHVVRDGQGLYWMFYTGVRDVLLQISPRIFAPRFQEIGVACSSDLVEWTRFDEPVWDCSRPDWTLCQAEVWNGGDFRDPFVMPEPSSPGEPPAGWLLVFTAHYDDEHLPAADPGDAWHNSYVLGAASAPWDDLHSWTDLGPIASTHRSAWRYYSRRLGSDRIESPHLFEHGGRWNLVFTPDPTKNLVVMTAEQPLGPFTFAGALDSLLGRDTTPWFATEALQVPNEDGTRTEYFAFVSDDPEPRHIQIHELHWLPNGRFTLVDPLDLVDLGWASPQVPEGQTTSLLMRMENRDTVTRLVHLEVFELGAAGGRTRVAPQQVGLPASIPLRWETTEGGVPAMRVSFTPRHDTRQAGGIPGLTRVVVRLNGRESGPLGIVAPGGSGRGRPSLEPTAGQPALDGPRTVGLGWLGLRAGPRAVLRVVVDAPCRGRLEVYDVTGQHLSTLHDGALRAGSTDVTWDTRDARGTPVPPGIYFARLTLPGTARTVRLPVLR